MHTYCPNITSFHIYEKELPSQWEEKVPFMEKLTSIVWKVSSAGIAEGVPSISALGSMRNLRSLSLFGYPGFTVSPSGDPWEFMKSLTALTSLTMANISCVDIGKILQRLPHLRSLTIKRTFALFDHDIAALSQHPSLTLLTLDTCRSLTPQAIQHIENIPHLEHVAIKTWDKWDCPISEEELRQELQKKRPGCVVEFTTYVSLSGDEWLQE